MSYQVPPLIGSNFITVFRNGRQYSVTKQDARFDEIKRLLKAKRMDEALLVFDRPAQIAKYTHGKVRVFESVLYYNDTALHSVLANRILAFVSEGLPYEPMVKFLNNLMENTSEKVRERLYDFIEKNQLAITDDGAMMTYKLARDDGAPYYQTHSPIRYKVGGVYEELDAYGAEDGTSICGAKGLFSGNKTYWNGQFDEQNRYTGEGRMFVAKVWPQDVVSVHTDSSKCAARRLEIVAEYENVRAAVNRPLYGTVVEPSQPVQPDALPSADRNLAATIETYIEENGPRTLKQIQSRFKRTSRLTCAALQEFIMSHCPRLYLTQNGKGSSRIVGFDATSDL